jgi:hypothetical protein
MCPTQYKVCANGTSIPVTQTCYVGSIASPYIAPQKIAFNNVVTSIATQITNTSGRCNAIGLIANNAPSVGWFEFGETANLGRETAHAMIGTSNTAPFSNALVGLKKNKTYYCRAIMKNQYGLVKGEIVSFITKTQPVSYVKPVSLSVKKTTTKTTTKKNELVCVDGKVVSSPSASSATLLNKGEKLIALQIEKTDGALRSESSVSYKISYKNLSDSRLTGMLIKVTVPEEVKLVSQTAGTFDETTHTLTLNQDTIDPYTEGSIMVTGKVEKDAPVGKSVVTTVYALYTVPGTNVQDEVTAYVVGSIVPMVDISKTDTGAKKVIGLSNGHSFLPQSLVEWLALIAILFIIFILGRSIYASYREDEGRSGHH